MEVILMDHRNDFLSGPIVWGLLMLALLAGYGVWRGLLVRRRRPAASALRLRKAHDLIHALDAYCDWIEAQRHIAFFTDETARADSPLDRARAIKQAHFPELSQVMVELLMVHTALTDFFWRQQVLRIKSPDGWVQAEHDAAYLLLKTRMLDAVRRMAEECRDLVGELPLPSALQEQDHAGMARA